MGITQMSVDTTCTFTNPTSNSLEPPRDANSKRTPVLTDINPNGHSEKKPNAKRKSAETDVEWNENGVELIWDIMLHQAPATLKLSTVWSSRPLLSKDDCTTRGTVKELVYMLF